MSPCDTVPMTKHEEIVWTHIHWRDRAQAISIADIKQRSGICERDIKAAVSGLRTRHAKLLCSSRSKTDGGYYAIATARRDRGQLRRDGAPGRGDDPRGEGDGAEQPARRRDAGTNPAGAGAVKRKTFFALWNQFARVADRGDRLLWCARQLGMPVDSMSLLSDDDFDCLIAELRRQLQQGSSRVVNLAGRAQRGPSKEQLWKVRQVEAYLGWKAVPERLAGFLREKFHVERPEQLSARDAWRVIEALIGVAAQSEMIRHADGKPARGEKKLVVARLKGVLATWRSAA